MMLHVLAAPITAVAAAEVHVVAALLIVHVTAVSAPSSLKVNALESFVPGEAVSSTDNAWAVQLVLEDRILTDVSVLVAVLVPLGAPNCVLVSVDRVFILPVRMPEGPLGPVGPVGPVAPVAPVGPVGPVGAVGPVAPGEL